MRALASLALLFTLSAPGCVLPAPAPQLPRAGEAAVVLLSGELPEPLTGVARHAWFAVRDHGESRWERWDLFQFPNHMEPELGHVHHRLGRPLTGVGGGYVMRHASLKGDEASHFIACLRREAPRYERRHDYLAWPGPNSNTFVDAMLRRCGFSATLPPTCIGKDHRGIAGASLTSGGTGVQLETPLIGIKLGLSEGVELHLLGLSFGVDLWPPAIELPWRTGRFGFPDR